jgi:hypothetical protein
VAVSLTGFDRPLVNELAVIRSRPYLQANQVRLAVIGDYGTASKKEEAVANLVKSWNPDFIITVGDNNYPDGTALTIDPNIGQYYHDFIFPYNGIYGSGSATNRFFPSLGNHDWRATGALPYLNYFTLPGNERYYDFIWGPVHLFALDSDPLLIPLHVGTWFIFTILPIHLAQCMVPTASCSGPIKPGALMQY